VNIEQNRSLKSLTTFKIGGPARFFVELAHANELTEALAFAEKETVPVLILGGGSNMLVSDRGFLGLVIHIANRGIDVQDLGTRTQLRIASGEVWDRVVQFAVERELWGIENLSRIPGQAGALAVQNVGAYGEEIKETLVSVEVFDRQRRLFRTLRNEECGFSYRKSIFNTSEKGRYIILFTTLALSRVPKRNISYPDVKKWFERRPEPAILEIREAIQAIRDKKFPFPAESIEGNAGSFFKNSVLPPDEYEKLESAFERNLPEQAARLRTIRARSEGGEIKIPSAFIFEACGLKGYREGNVQLNPTQPVIVLNETGEATAKEVLTLVHHVRTIVRDKTGLHLYTEPELIGFTAEELRSYGFNEEEIARYCYGR